MRLRWLLAVEISQGCGRVTRRFCERYLVSQRKDNALDRPHVVVQPVLRCGETPVKSLLSKVRSPRCQLQGPLGPAYDRMPLSRCIGDPRTTPKMGVIIVGASGFELDVTKSEQRQEALLGN